MIILRGAVAQLARALHSHCRGQGFKSPQLHQSFDNARHGLYAVYSTFDFL